MTSRLLHIFLALFLLFAQQQALVHPLQHLSPATQQQKSNKSVPSQDTHHEETCGKCISLAGMGSAVASHANFLPPALIAQTPVTTHTSLYTQAFRSLYQSRAPPILHIA